MSPEDANAGGEAPSLLVRVCRAPDSQGWRLEPPGPSGSPWPSCIRLLLPPYTFKRNQRLRASLHLLQASLILTLGPHGLNRTTLLARDAPSLYSKAHILANALVISWRPHTCGLDFHILPLLIRHSSLYSLMFASNLGSPECLEEKQ